MHLLASKRGTVTAAKCLHISLTRYEHEGIVASVLVRCLRVRDWSDLSVSACETTSERRALTVVPQRQRLSCLDANDPSQCYLSLVLCSSHTRVEFECRAEKIRIP